MEEITLEVTEDTIEDIIEPYLIQQAFLQRTPRGRVLTRFGYEHLGLNVPKQTHKQIELLLPDDKEGTTNV